MSHPESRKAHWNEVHRGRAVAELTWFQAVPKVSLDLIREVVTDHDQALIDIGGGASVLVDALLRDGFSDLTVVDISGQALSLARARLGSQAERVVWIEADLTQIELPRRYTLWHDRAVFHFLTMKPERQAYLDRLHRHLEPSGWLILATFALDGPEQCSGLPVQRYDEQTLSELLGDAFRLDAVVPEVHTTPAGRAQPFVYCRFRRES